MLNVYFQLLFSKFILARLNVIQLQYIPNERFLIKILIVQPAFAVRVHDSALSGVTERGEKCMHVILRSSLFHRL